MKKILVSIAIMITMCLGANAQNDGFFNNWDNMDNGLDRYNEGGITFNLPSSHGYDGNQSAPLGSGILILTALGAGYAMKKKHSEKE